MNIIFGKNVKCLHLNVHLIGSGMIIVLKSAIPWRQSLGVPDQHLGTVGCQGLGRAGEGHTVEGVTFSYSVPTLD